jgi:rare lipoprotein A
MTWWWTATQARGLSTLLLVSALVGCGVSGCTPTVRHPLPPPVSSPSSPSSSSPSQIGVASWYGPGFQGRPTASGERFHSQELTAAHPTLPLGSHVTVTNLANGKSVRVRINDRGPYVRGRSIDLSRGAARKIGLERRGVAPVRITIHPPRRRKSQAPDQSVSSS